MQILIRKLTNNIPTPTITAKGDWIDLYAAKDTIVGDTPVTYIPLGIAMRLPSGCEAILAPRSSTPKNFHIWCPISFGVIDNTFCGPDDQWHFPATTIGLSRTTIHQGDRICQFRIQLSQKATLWQRIKWFFRSPITIAVVKTLPGENRGGFGSTGTR